MRMYFSLVAFSLSLICALPAAENAASSKKRTKAHYAGTKVKPTSVEKSAKKKSTKVKNEWVASKTHPKEVKKAEIDAEDLLVTLLDLPEDRPMLIRNPYQSPRASSDHSLSQKVADLEVQVERLKEEEYPKTGREASRAHVYVTGEWLFFRARQEGMEYATAKKVHFDYASGFRVGLGVHLPQDGWDIYVNYTQFNPEHSDSVHHTTFPLFLYQATDFVTFAHAHWKIAFQSVDIEIGRAFYLSRSLSLRPYFGLKGAWIDQHAKIHYRGGFIPVAQEYSTRFKNDFKGAGPRVGCQSHWDLAWDLSFFTDFAFSLIIGQFDNDQEQHQLDGFESIDLNTNFHLVSPNAQMVVGLAWDRNFSANRYHLGIRAGFETQVYWSQNQTEQFTSQLQPIYVRQDGDLAFYGLTLQGRLDF